MTDFLRTIEKDEKKYETALRKIADRVCFDYDIRFVLIAGGSCSGKTTSTKKLAGLIKERKRNVHTISLDDFYRNIEDSVYLPDGTRDLETLNSLETDKIKECLKSIAQGKRTPVPYFDFEKKKRTDNYRYIDPEPDDVIIVEGLHALNPVLYDRLSERAVYRVFLYADAEDGSDCRFVRRLVRDSRHRDSDAEMIFSLWDNVKKNEQAAIDPFRKIADVAVNTFFEYERGILDDDALKLLNELPKDSKYREKADKLAKILEGTVPLPDEEVPKDSLLREFM